jgi:hypothetical protein
LEGRAGAGYMLGVVEPPFLCAQTRGKAGRGDYEFRRTLLAAAAAAATLLLTPRGLLRSATAAAALALATAEPAAAPAAAAAAEPAAELAAAPAVACDEACRQRIADRRAIFAQSRTTTSRQNMMDLSKQRAALYNTTYQGASCIPGIPCL